MNTDRAIIQSLIHYFSLTTILVTILIVSAVPLGLPTAASAADKFFVCTPIDVAVFSTRIAVRCSPGDGAITFFASDLKNDAKANRLLSVLSTAFTTKKRLNILYDPQNLQGGNIGCLNKDCRLMTGAVMF